MRASVSRKWKSSATMFRGHLDALHDESILISLYLARVMLPRLLSDRFVIIPTDFLVQNFNKIGTMFQQSTSQVLHYFLFYFLLVSNISSQIVSKFSSSFNSNRLENNDPISMLVQEYFSARKCIHIQETFLEDQF